MWGVGYYLVVLVLALAGLRPAWSDERWVSQLLVGITATGVMFSAWLTWLELYVIHAICRWCVVSAVLATLLLLVSLLDLREVSAIAMNAAAEAAAKLRLTGYGTSIRNTEEVSIRAVTPDV
ncbi:hypothetical protein BH11GEM1_BH11GEM1_20960 [soil metagenome]